MRERAREPKCDKAAEWSLCRRGFGENAGSAVYNHLGLKGRKEGRLAGRRAEPLMPSFHNIEKNAHSPH